MAKVKATGRGASRSAAKRVEVSKTQAASSAQTLRDFCEEKGIQIIDLKFVDLFGILQHISITIDELNEGLFSDGKGFDGSSIRGFKSIESSDMLLFPDPATAIVDPGCQVPTLSMFCNVVDPMTREAYSRDARYIGQKAEAYLESTGIGDVSYWGPEIEFFVFDSVRFDQGQNFGYYFIDSDEGIWNSGRENNGTPNLGFRPRNKEGYFPCPPVDSIQDFRSKAVLKMREAGIRVEVHHHEVATAGQCEIDMRYQRLTKMGDQCLLYKYILRNVAASVGKSVTFMPKPLFQDNGSGMHVHSSIWKKGVPNFADKTGYAGMSQQALWYIGGLLKHAPAILALAAPTTNSYRRLVPGYEAPVNLCYSARNRSAICRIPMYSNAPAAKRIEFRAPDPSSNPYLTFAAILMAGLDGIQNRINPGKPVEKDTFELQGEEAAAIPSVPGSLSDALDALEKDHDFLLKGGVFTKDVIETWISWKRKKDVDPVRLRPHPYEFFLYYDA